MDPVQLVSLAGAATILVAYALAQARRLDPSRLAYQVANFVGAGTLAVVAGLERQPGFLVLEGAWAGLSLWGIVAVLRAAPEER